MVLFKWNDSLSVNVKVIDSQHQRLVNLINQLHELMKMGKSSDAIKQVIEDLTDYSVTHFSTEEEYFNKFNYDGAEAHIDEHRMFVMKVLEFKTAYESGKAALSIEVMNFLKDWLINHINGTDKKYTKCFNDHGLK